MEKNHKQFNTFDKVLVKGMFNKWQIDFYSYWDKEEECHNTLSFGGSLIIKDPDILPYTGNEHLVGATDESNESGNMILVATTDKSNESGNMITTQPLFTLTPEEVQIVERNLIYFFKSDKEEVDKIINKINRWQNENKTNN